MTLSGLEHEPFAASGEDGVRIPAGSRGSLHFNVTQFDGPSPCVDASDVLDAADLVAAVEIHGVTFEVAGSIERFCSIPAPHTCG